MTRCWVGGDPLAPLQDVINDEGDIVVPVDPRYLGLWLTGLFGDPDTTDNLDGSWDHESASGGEDLGAAVMAPPAHADPVTQGVPSLPNGGRRRRTRMLRPRPPPRRRGCW